ncbi:MAG: GerMN domain-containing protein [Patescibacteria group bacterium]|nr:MAG: GerMN domain-containing protein [Patescibacteria group bacterium]
MNKIPLKHLLAIFAALAILALGAWLYTNAQDPVEGLPDPGTLQQQIEPDSKYICEAAGGFWNECASACPPDAEACILMCVQKCEFLEDDDVEPETVRLYFLNDKLDPEQTCEKVFPVERSLVRFPDDYPTMQALLDGPTKEERAAGYETAIPANVEFLSFDSEEGRNVFTFDERLDRGVAGSCRVGAIRAQIEATARAQGMVPANGAIEIVAGEKSPAETLQP